MKGRVDRGWTSTREEEYRDLAHLGQPLKPLRELLGLVSSSSPSPAHPKHLFYNVVNTSVWPGPSMRKRRRRWRRRKDKEIPSGENGDKVPVESFRTTPNMPRIATDILPRQTTPSSSIFSSPIHDDVPPTPSILSEDIISPTEPQDTSCPAPPRDTHSLVQSNDISSCSEVEAFLGASQQQPPRRKARKRRRITSKLSLSQNSHRQDQSSQASDNVPILTEVLHIPSSVSSSTSTSSSSTSTSSLHTNMGTNRNPDPSTTNNIPMQEASFESQNLLAPVVAKAVHQPAKPPSSSSTNINTQHTNTGTIRNVDGSLRQEASFESQSLLAPFMARGVHQPAEPTKQSESIHTLGHTQVWLPQQGIKAGTVNAVHCAASYRKHMRNKAGISQGRRVTFQSPTAPVVHGSGDCCELDSHARPQALSAGWQEDVTLASTSDSDQSVYYEAASHLTILDESCAGPSGVQNNPQLPAGQTLLPIAQQGDADTSSSSFSQRESDYTSHSLSSSGSSTCVGGSLLNKTVITNKQSAGTFKRPAQEVYKKRNHPASLKQIRRHEPQLGRLQNKVQLNLQPRTSRKAPTTSGWSQERRQRQNHKEMKSPDQSTRSSWQTVEAEVSSSTSEPQSEGELSGQQVQGAKRPLPMMAASRLEGSAVSSSSCSSSSSSSVLLTQEGMGCIQTIGEVFKHYFGGTVEDNLSLIQRNNYNLLQCLMELQAAPHLSHHHQPLHDPSPF